MHYFPSPLGILRGQGPCWFSLLAPSFALSTELFTWWIFHDGWGRGCHLGCHVLMVSASSRNIPWLIYMEKILFERTLGGSQTPRRLENKVLDSGCVRGQPGSRATPRASLVRTTCHHGWPLFLWLHKMALSHFPHSENRGDNLSDIFRGLWWRLRRPPSTWA